VGFEHLKSPEIEFFVKDKGPKVMAEFTPLAWD
jgi:hypothetical protein